MRIRLFIALALVLVAAPVAPAQDPAPSTPAEACSVEMTEQRALIALQQALREPLPGRVGRSVPVQVTPCSPGRLVLRVRHATKTGVMLAEADRTLRSTATATMQLRTTRAVERYRGKKLRLHTRAIFLP